MPSRKETPCIYPTIQMKRTFYSVIKSNCFLAIPGLNSKTKSQYFFIAVSPTGNSLYVPFLMRLLGETYSDRWIEVWLNCYFYSFTRCMTSTSRIPLRLDSIILLGRCTASLSIEFHALLCTEHHGSVSLCVEMI
jgi:hypothetical protein